MATPPLAAGVDEYGDVLWVVLKSANKPSWCHMGFCEGKTKATVAS